MNRIEAVTQQIETDAAARDGAYRHGLIVMLLVQAQTRYSEAAPEEPPRMANPARSLDESKRRKQHSAREYRGVGFRRRQI